MSQGIWSTINPASTSGNQLATYLNDFKDALMTSLSGTTRPTELDIGGIWLDITADPIWELKIWDGVADTTLLTINTTSGNAFVSEAEDSYTIHKTSVDTAAPVLKLLKSRIANNGQVLSGDYIGEVQFAGNADDLSVPITVKIRAIATQNYTGANGGTDLVFESCSTGSVVAAEWMRLTNGKLGLGTTAPENSLHVKGDGVRSEHVSADAVGAKVILRKKRIATNGQVLASDVIGQAEFNSTDDAGTEVAAAKVEVKATQNHTSTAHGTSVGVSVKKTGETAFTEQVLIGDNVNVKADLLADKFIQMTEVVDSATTGAAQSLSPTTSILKVTNASLTSVNNIVAKAGAILVLINGVGAGVTITNDSGGTAANRIKTGTGADLILGDNASLILAYDGNSSRWQVVGGSGGGGTLSQGTRAAGVSISAATQITCVAGQNTDAYVVGNGGAVIVTAGTPVVVSGMSVGQLLTIIGTSDTNTVTYNNGNNLVLTGSATLGKDQSITLKYVGSDGSNASWLEVGRNC